MAWISQSDATTRNSANHSNSRNDISANASSHPIGNPAMPSRTSVLAQMKTPSSTFRAIILEVISPPLGRLRDRHLAAIVGIAIGDTADAIAIKPDISELAVVQVAQGRAGREPFAAGDHGLDTAVDETPDPTAQPARVEAN